MLSGTWNRYRQTFAAPGKILLQKELGDHSNSTTEEGGTQENMLLIQPRKRSRTNADHATSHPASWQPEPKETSTNALETDVELVPLDKSITRESYNAFSKTKIAALSLEQLQQLNILVEDRIQIKQRYNNTPLRRNIVRQVSSRVSKRTEGAEDDTFSQTDTLVNTDVQEVARESPETIQARYNSTPLRRILSRQVSAEKRAHELSDTFTPTRYEPEPLEVRKARYNSTPLRRILSRQTTAESAPVDALSPIESLPSTAFSQPYTPTPVPRSDTPLRRILSRQTSASTTTEKDNGRHSNRADSVIDPDSPTRSCTTHHTSVPLNSVAEALAHDEAPKNKRTPSVSSRIHLNSETEIRAYEEALWAKPASPKHLRRSKEEKKSGTTVTVTEIAVEAKKAKRIVVDSKGSPLRRILQRQGSGEVRAVVGVGVV